MNKCGRGIWSNALLMLGSVTLAVAATAASFSGTWHLNLEKSQLTGQTLKIAKTPAGKMHYEMQGYGYDFDVTGEEYPTPDGGTVSWRALSPTSWEVTNRMNGKVTSTYRVSLDGDTINWSARMIKPDGSVTEESAKTARVSGGPGLLGTWKSTEVKGAPSTVEISTDGENGITIGFPEGQAVTRGNFDGKDYVVKVAEVPSKQAMVFEKLGPSSFKLTTKLDGKPIYEDVFTLSADGKTLTDDGNPISGHEPVKAVYERQ